MNSARPAPPLGVRRINLVNNRRRHTACHRRTAYSLHVVAVEEFSKTAASHSLENLHFFLKAGGTSWQIACNLPTKSMWSTGRSARRFLQKQGRLAQCLRDTCQYLIHCLQPPHQLQAVYRTECSPFFFAETGKSWYIACQIPAKSRQVTGRNARVFLQSQNAIFHFGEQFWSFLHQNSSILG